jgi:hypothetical protein
MMDGSQTYLHGLNAKLISEIQKLHNKCSNRLFLFLFKPWIETDFYRSQVSVPHTVPPKYVSKNVDSKDSKMRNCLETSHHQFINVPTTGARAFFMNYT